MKFERLRFILENHPKQDGILATFFDILDAIDYSKDNDYEEESWLLYYYVLDLFEEDFDNSRFEQDFRRRWPGRWDEFMANTLATFIVLSAYPDISAKISQLLQIGANPNRSNYTGVVPLTYAISMLGRLHNDESRRLFTRPYLKEFLLGRNSLNYLEKRNEDSERLLRIVVLVMGGADIHYMMPGYFDLVEHWGQLDSHCQQ